MQGMWSLVGGRRPPARVAAVVLAAAIAVGTAAAVAAASGGAAATVTVRLGGDWFHFDMQAYETGNTPFLTAFYDRLVGWGPKRKLVPYLATSWKQTPTKVTFQLRRDAKCADGTPVTPQVIVNSMRRLFEGPKQNNFLLQYFGPGPYSIARTSSSGVQPRRQGALPRPRGRLRLRRHRDRLPRGPGRGRTGPARARDAASSAAARTPSSPPPTATRS